MIGKDKIFFEMAGVFEIPFFIIQEILIFQLKKS